MGFSADVLKAQVVSCLKIIDLYVDYSSGVVNVSMNKENRKCNSLTMGHLLFHRINCEVYSTDVDRTEWQSCVRRTKVLISL